MATAPKDEKAQFAGDATLALEHTQSPGSDKLSDVEDLKNAAHNEGGANDLDAGFAPEAVKRITRKIDYRIIPVLSMGYLISLIDRTNLAVARSANDMQMDRDLGLTSNDRYSIITLML